PARRGRVASGPEEVTDSAVSTRAVIVSAKGAARWQAGHPWIYRTDIYDEPRDAPGIVTVTDRRGRHLGQALYSPTSEIRLRLLTTGREAIDATWWADRIAAAVQRRAGIPATAYCVVHGEADGLPSLVVDRYGPYTVAHVASAAPAPGRAPPAGGGGWAPPRVAWGRGRGMAALTKSRTPPCGGATHLDYCATRSHAKRRSAPSGRDPRRSPRRNRACPGRSPATRRST